MMDVRDRIEQAPACEVIRLTDPEKAIYTGAGWRLASFERGVLVGLFYPVDVERAGSDRETATRALDAAVAWAARQDGDTWLYSV